MLAVTGTPVVLVPVSETTFRASIVNTSVAFAVARDGSVVMEETAPDGDKSTYRRMPAPKTDASTLAEFAGDYVSDRARCDVARRDASGRADRPSWRGPGHHAAAGVPRCVQFTRRCRALPASVGWPSDWTRRRGGARHGIRLSASTERTNFMKRLGCVRALLALLIVCRPPSVLQGQQTSRTAAGTYQIAVCKRTPCSPLAPTGAAAAGILVLLDSAIPLGALPEGAQLGLRTMYLDGPANGCFTLRRPFVPNESFAGIAGVGSTRWAKDSSGYLTFTLYQSPDARHAVRALLVGDTLRGIGESSGAGLAEVHWPRDTVIAVRVGPPDTAPCVDASLRDYAGRVRSPWRR